MRLYLIFIQFIILSFAISIFASNRATSDSDAPQEPTGVVSNYDDDESDLDRAEDEEEEDKNPIYTNRNKVNQTPEMKRALLNGSDMADKLNVMGLLKDSESVVKNSKARGGEQDQERANEKAGQFVDSFTEEMNSLDTEQENTASNSLSGAGLAVRDSTEGLKQFNPGSEKPAQVNWSKPGNRRYILNAHRMGDEANVHFRDMKRWLDDNLKIKCKKVKGNKVQLPTVATKEVVVKKDHYHEYDPAICTEKRRIYRCTDSLVLRCRKRGRKYEQWEDGQEWRKRIGKGEYQVCGAFAVNNQWGKYETWKGDKVHYLTRTEDGYSRAAQNIADNSGVSRDQIRVTSINWAADGYKLTRVGKFEYIFQGYRPTFQYRNAEDICLEWEESWEERCTVSPWGDM